MARYSYKVPKLSTGPSAGSCQRHSYITQNWVLLSATKPKDLFLPLEYKVYKSKLKTFTPLYSPPTAEKARRREPPRTKSRLPDPITRQELKDYPDMDDYLNYKAICENRLGNAVKLRSSVGTYNALSRKWETTNERYAQWKLRRSVCDPLPEDTIEAEPKEADSESPVSETVVENAPSSEWSSIEKSDSEAEAACRTKKPVKNPIKQQALFKHETPKASDFNKLLNSQQHFREESVSSEEEAQLKRREVDKEIGLIEIPVVHQRKYRRLRRATKDLIAWINSLKPDRPLNFHLVTNLDGTKTNIPIKPYVPYPEEDQPYPLINEDKVVEMVKNSYGSRPAMTLRVAVRDVENLPEELEKFDDVHYLKRKVINDRINPKEKKENDGEVKPITRYSFGFDPDKLRKNKIIVSKPLPKNRRISAVGTVYDTKTGRHCRYGAWYLRRSTWRKMDASEEIKQPGLRNSDVAFERVTGQKRLLAVDTHTPFPAAGVENTSDVSHLHTAKEFYKLLKSRDMPIPAWLRSCEGALAQIKIENTKQTAPFGSEVWREAREKKNELTSCHLPGTPVESLLRTDLYCYDSGPKKPVVIENSESGEYLTGISPKCYAFLEGLEQGPVRAAIQ